MVWVFIFLEVLGRLVFLGGIVLLGKLFRELGVRERGRLCGVGGFEERGRR